MPLAHLPGFLHLDPFKRNLLWFSIGLAALLVAFYYPWLSNKQSFYLSDLTYYYEPLLAFIGGALRKNVLPLWNPYFYCGMSQIALLAPGIFYPPNWLFAFLPFSPAAAWFMVWHQFVAGIGGYLLVASLSWGATAAAVCGLVLALNGYMFSLQTNFPLPATACWLPLCLWAQRMIGPNFSKRNLMLVITLVLGSFALISSGRPEISIPALILLAGYLSWDVVSFCKLQNSSGVATTLWRLLALLLGFLMSMPAILPALEWTSLSPRAHGLTNVEVFRWSTNWYDLLCLILSQPLGDLQVLGGKYLPLVATRPGFIPYVSSAFVGPVVATLALWGALDTNWRKRWLVLATLVAGLLATLGNNTPVFPWFLKVLPGLAAFRYPVKLIVILVWCLALLAARGVFVALGRGLSSKVYRLTCGLWVACLLASLTLVAASWFGLVVFFLDVPPHIGTDLLRKAQELLGYAGLRGALIGLGVCAVAQLLRREKISAKAFIVMVIAGLTATLLASAFLFTRHGAPPDFFRRSCYLKTTLERLTKHKPATGPRILPLYFDPLTCPPQYGDRAATSKTVDFYQYSRELLLPCINMDAGLASAFGYESAETSDYRDIFVGVLNQASIAGFLRGHSVPTSAKKSDVPLARFCQMTSAGYVFTQMYQGSPPILNVPLLDKQYFELINESPSMNVRIYKARESLPRAYLAMSWQWETSHEHVVKQIVNAQASCFNPAKKTILECQGCPGKGAPFTLPTSAATTESSAVEFLQDGVEHIALSVRTHSLNCLVLADHFYPGWTAKIDNVVVPVYRANAVLRAVFVPPGSHLVEFDYNPDSLALGCTLAFLGGTVVLCLVVIMFASKYWPLVQSQAKTKN